MPRGPIALCEVQGYVFAAKVSMAWLFQRLGVLERAAQLQAEAAELRRRFNDRFWLADQDMFALGLDGEKRPIDAVASNAGQCLWSGIAYPEQGARLARRLLADELFSGWGVRTLSTRMAAYNPIGCHNGAVWPHDNALIAAGLARYGHTREANQIIRGQFEAASHFPGHRLPELFAGLSRSEVGFPVEYPYANAPQAWAAGAVILFLETWLGLAPSGRRLQARPLPDAPRMCWRGLRFRGRSYDIGASGPRAAQSKSKGESPTRMA